jgi:metallophosphoesterase (TIGR00282 family)
LFDSGVNVITGGNHVLRRRQIYDLLEEETGLIRPANYHAKAPGAGIFYHDAVRFRLCVINLQGIAYMQNIENPFDCIDELLKTVDTPNIIVDFHAEATAEKICMGYYLDGRVSVVVGTHTHVPTNDIRILPGGTGYLTDLGMVGGAHSVLGVEARDAIFKMRTSLPNHFNNDPRDVQLSGAVFTLDDATGKCTHAESLINIM